MNSSSPKMSSVSVETSLKNANNFNLHTSETKIKLHNDMLKKNGPIGGNFKTYPFKIKNGDQVKMYSLYLPDGQFNIKTKTCNKIEKA